MRRILTFAWAGLLALVTNVSQAELPDGLIMDHGYTWFHVKAQVGHQDGSPVDEGWQLYPSFRIIGETPNNSAFKWVVKRDGDVVAEQRATANRATANTGRVQYPSNPAPIAAMWLRIADFATKTPAVQGTGEFEVDVYYVDGGTLEEHFAHTYTIEVGQVLKVRGPANLPQPDVGDYYVSRHQEAISTLLTGTMAYATGSEVQHVPKVNGHYTLYWNVSPEDYRWSGTSSEVQRGAYLACTVNGEPLVWGNPKSANFQTMSAAGSLDDTSTKTSREESVMHSDRNSLEYRAGTPYREYLEFMRLETRIPLVFGLETKEYPEESRAYTSSQKHPGKWDCKFIETGEVLRIFRWEINPDGTLKPHPEQEEGLTLAPNTILVETLIPQGGASFDGRLVPDAVEAGGFYGWEWRSDEMEDLAEEVPAVGQPYPIASAPEFVPAPEKGPSDYEVARAQREAAAADAAAERRAEQAANQAQRDADREAAAMAQAEREAKTEAERQAAYEKALAESQAQVEASLQEAQRGIEDAQQQASYGALHWLFRLLLALGLIAMGMVLNGAALREMAGGLGSVIDVLSAQGKLIAFAVIGIAAIDLLLDLLSLRPVIGDGLPQLAGIAGGILGAKSSIGAQAAAEKHADKLEKLEANSPLIGWACLALGVVHLILGGLPLV